MSINKINIFLAFKKCNIIEIDRYIKEGGSLFVTDEYGQSLLHYAAKMGYEDYLNFISSRTRMSVIDKDEVANKILDQAKKMSRKYSKLLINEGLNVNITTSLGIPPIFYVVSFGDEELFDFFMENGADLKIKSKTGLSIVDIVQNSSNFSMKYKVFEYLEAKGIERGKNQNCGYRISKLYTPSFLKLSDLENDEVRNIKGRIYDSLINHLRFEAHQKYFNN
jgi:ankyrin repeat protein